MAVTSLRHKTGNATRSRCSRLRAVVPAVMLLLFLVTAPLHCLASMPPVMKSAGVKIGCSDCCGHPVSHFELKCCEASQQQQPAVVAAPSIHFEGVLTVCVDCLPESRSFAALRIQPRLLQGTSPPPRLTLRI